MADVFGFEMPFAGLNLFNGSAEVLKDFRHEADIGQVGNALDDTLFAGEQSCGKNRECGIFGSTDRNGTAQ